MTYHQALAYSSCTSSARTTDTEHSPVRTRFITPGALPLQFLHDPGAGGRRHERTQHRVAYPMLFSAHRRMSASGSAGAKYLWGQSPVTDAVVSVPTRTPFDIHYGARDDAGGACREGEGSIPHRSHQLTQTRREHTASGDAHILRFTHPRLRRSSKPPRGFSPRSLLGTMAPIASCPASPHSTLHRAARIGMRHGLVYIEQAKKGREGGREQAEEERVRVGCRVGEVIMVGREDAERRGESVPRRG
jgi:hypothetical protein